MDVPPEITADYLTRLPIIVREKHAATNYLIDNELKKIGLSYSDLNVVMSLHGATAIREMVKNGKYCGFIPLSLINNADATTYYHIVRIKDVIFERNICLYREKNKTLSPYSSIFRRYILGNEWRGYPFNTV